MKKIRWLLLLLGICVFSVQKVSAWGSTGHRAIAEIAYCQLSAETKAKVKDILGNAYLPLYANWADEICSDKDNPYNSLPHYVNMSLDVKYEQAEKNPKGDLVSVMEDMVEMLQSQTSSHEEKVTALKFIIHLVGDAHQPMHVALSEDLGGNMMEVQWFRKTSNLHKLWDEDLIDYSRLSYKELAIFAGELQMKEIRAWQNLSLVDWINETHEITKDIYENLGDKNYSYVYNYQYSPVVYQQIQKAGYRLALFLTKVLE